MENDPNNPSPAEPNPAEARHNRAVHQTQPVLKYLAASDVLRNVRTYTYLIAGFLIPLLLLTYILPPKPSGMQSKDLRNSQPVAASQINRHRRRNANGTESG